MKIQRDTMLGLVFFAGLGLLGWASVSLTNFSLDPKPTVVVYFDNAQGLRAGDPVFVLGTRGGQVKEVALSQESNQPPIRVTLELDQTLPPMADDRRIEIRQANLLGGSQIDIDPGRGGGEIDPPYRGERRQSALDSIGEADIAGTAESIRVFFDRLVDPDNAVGALLSSREPFDDLAAALASARRIIEEVETGEGTLGQIIHNKELADDVTVAVAEFREIIHKVNEGTGLAARIINDGEMAADVGTTLSDVRQMVSGARRGEGLLGRLISDPATAESFDDTLASVRSVTAKLDDPDQGLLSALIGDPEMANQGRELVANLADTSRKINEGEGLLGRMINDEEMAEKLDRVLNQVSGAIEDAREAAPVGTFFQVLASPF